MSRLGTGVLFCVGKSLVVILVDSRSVLIEINGEIQNSQLQLCSTMFPVFHSLDLFHTSEHKKYMFLIANRKYKCSVSNFRVKWKLTLCRLQKIIFQGGCVGFE